MKNIDTMNNDRSNDRTDWSGRQRSYRQKFLPYCFCIDHEERLWILNRGYQIIGWRDSHDIDDSVLTDKEHEYEEYDKPVKASEVEPRPGIGLDLDSKKIQEIHRLSKVMIYDDYCSESTKRFLATSFMNALNIKMRKEDDKEA